MMLTLSDIAKKEVRNLLRGKRGERRCVRLIYNDNPYIELSPVSLTACHPGSPRLTVFKKGLLGVRRDFTVLLDAAQSEQLDGAHIHYLQNARGPGAFEIFLAKEQAAEMPITEPGAPKSEAAKKIQEFLDKEINPAIASHGGRAEILELNSGVAALKLSGGCQGCAASSLTLRQGIETRLKETFPEIIEVVDRTDHAAGTAPYIPR